MSDDYFIGVHDREVQRLHDQNAAWLPESRALWVRAGFEQAARIADLGSGPGFTTFDLAGLVGPRGSVTAIDKAASYLRFVETEAKRRNLTNVGTLECDIASSGFGEGEYDAAFCRFFLAFLIDDLDAALAHIRTSLKPGATFAAMEYLTLKSATCAPPSRSFDAHTRAWIDYYAAHGGDTTVGAVLPHKLHSAGFDVIDVACVGGIASAGSRWWTWWGRLMADFGEKLVAAGHMTETERVELERDWARASSDVLAFIHTPVLVQIVARRR